MIEFFKEAALVTHSWTGVPWWAMLIGGAVVMRVLIFPLIVFQFKRASRITPIAPVFTFIKQTARHSPSRWFALKTALSLYRIYSQKLGFSLTTMFAYNLAYYPLLVSMVFSMRKILAIPEVGATSFLYLETLSQIDPYYILPTLTVMAYYYNFQRFITPENRHTFISRVRTACQVLLIAWYPFLCCWPSGLTLYMFANALISILQSSLLTSPIFLSRLSPHIVRHNQLLGQLQYDKQMAMSVCRAIQRGEQSFGGKGISEEKLMLQVEGMVKRVNEDAESGIGKKELEDGLKAMEDDRNSRIDSKKQEQKYQPIANQSNKVSQKQPNKQSAQKNNKHDTKKNAFQTGIKK